VDELARKYADSAYFDLAHPTSQDAKPRV
jgi:hypothetical protein